jgi:hypothetical protein
MQIHTKHDLMAGYVRRTRAANAAARTAILILKLVIYEHIERPAERVGHIHSAKPV